mmetsp:Transcript_3981/g.15857  ORF Transcript_3981/g.15857 Transcript_3981/m.15857 type:complete len:240 (+) Transcript_3981:1400-2119(+)
MPAASTTVSSDDAPTRAAARVVIIRGGARAAVVPANADEAPPRRDLPSLGADDLAEEEDRAPDEAEAPSGGKKSQSQTVPAWPRSTPTHAPDTASQRRAVPSAEAVTTRLPWSPGEKAHEKMMSEWPRSVSFNAPDCASHTRPRSSSDAVASRRPDGDTATALTSTRSPNDTAEVVVGCCCCCCCCGRPSPLWSWAVVVHASLLLVMCAAPLPGTAWGSGGLASERRWRPVAASKTRTV